MPSPNPGAKSGVEVLDESRRLRDAHPVSGGDVGDAEGHRGECGRLIQELKPKAPQSVASVG